MGLPFFDHAHARQKLDSTIVRYKGHPYFARSGVDHRVVLYSMQTGSTVDTVSYLSDDFDYSDVPLGYMFHRGAAIYVTRAPARVNRQAPSSTTLRYNPQQSPISFNEIVFNGDLYNCIMGIYPSYLEAKQLLEQKATSVPITRHLAIQKLSPNLWAALYRGRTIATSSDRGETYQVGDESVSHLLVKRLNKAGLRVTAK